MIYCDFCPEDILTTQERVLTTSIPQISLIDIRTFKSYEEIRDDVDGFIKNHPLSKLAYAKIIGDYNFEDEVNCCFQKENGKLCGEEHKRGWVARLQDGTATIIGNHCAENNFGADSRLISDRSRYINEKSRRERLASLMQLIEEKDTRIARLTALRHEVKALESRIRVVADPLGALIQRRLKDMIRTGRGDVAVTAVKNRAYVDNDGRRKTERSTFVQILGTLAGVDLVAVGTFEAFYESINEIVCAYHRAQELTQDADLVKRSREVESIAGKLQAFDRVAQEATRLLDLEAPFFANNFLLLCFLTDNRDERIKAAKVALRRSRKSEHISRVEEWLSEQQNAIVTQLKVDAIEIQ
jgi:hypothetical protein